MMDEPVATTADQTTTKDAYGNLADDSGELDYEESEPAGADSAKEDVQSDDEAVSSLPQRRTTVEEVEDLEEGEVDEMEDGEVKEEGEEDDDDDDGQHFDHQPKKSQTVKTAAKITEKRPSSAAGATSRPEDMGICKFYIRGSCTWGNFCKFLHPGVNERGGYQMRYEANPPNLLNAIQAPPPPLMSQTPQPLMLRRALPPQPLLPLAHSPPPPTQPSESAWERGLKQAREMMKKANEKKENDADFEEKRFNLPMDTAEAAADEPELAPNVRSTTRTEFNRYESEYSREQVAPSRPTPPMDSEGYGSGRGGASGGRYQQPPPNRYYNIQYGDMQSRNFRNVHNRLNYQQQQTRYTNNSNNGSVAMRQDSPPSANQRHHRGGAGYGYEQRRQARPSPPAPAADKDSGRPLPYERPSYEVREWRDPWMRSNNKRTTGNDYTAPVDRATGGNERKRRRRRSAASGSSSSSRSTSSRSASSAGSTSSRSVSSIGTASSSASSSRRVKGRKTHRGSKSKMAKVDAGDAVHVESSSRRSPPKQTRSVSPISKESTSPTPTDELIDNGKRTSPAPAAPKVPSPRKPISLKIMNKSKVQVAPAYDDEIVKTSSRKFEPLSPARSTSTTSGGGDKRSRNGAAAKRADLDLDLEDISPQEDSDNDDEVAKSATVPPSVEEDAKTVSSRREELLKQLKAVEEAIAKKRTTKAAH